MNTFSMLAVIALVGAGLISCTPMHRDNDSRGDRDSYASNRNWDDKNWHYRDRDHDHGDKWGVLRERRNDEIAELERDLQEERSRHPRGYANQVDRERHDRMVERLDDLYRERDRADD